MGETVCPQRAPVPVCAWHGREQFEDEDIRLR